MNINESFVKAFKGNQISCGLEETNVKLALIQSAAIMALEGMTRATASEVANRAIEKYGIEPTASFTGQVFSQIGIRTATSHGSSRFVLDYDSLEEIRKGIVAQCKEQAAKLEEAIKEFGNIPERIANLQAEWQEILSQRNKEQEYIRAINEYKSQPSRLNYLQSEFRKIEEVKKRLKQEETAVDELKEECQALSQKINKLPSLEEKKKSLEARITKYEEEQKSISVREREISFKENQIATRETALQERIVKLQKRTGWVELAELQEAIESGRQELKKLSRQLGEKRSLLDKLGIRRKENTSR